MATKSGAVFIFSNFVILPYFNLTYPITKIKRLPPGADDQDAILCCGHFNKLCMLQNKTLVSSYETKDWIHSIELLDEQYCNDGHLLVLGCLDNSATLLRVKKSRQ